MELDGGRESGNDGERRNKSGVGSGCGLAGEGRARSVSLASSFFSISFSRLVKNFTKRNFIFPFLPSPAFARHGTAGYPPPVAGKYLSLHNVFLLSLEK